MEIKQMFISNNRSYKSLSPRGIVAHSTSNRGATAMNHYKYFNNAYRGASCHIVVDWNEAIQLVPFNEVSWHAGGTANRTYIGIEICEPSKGDVEKFNKVWNNAVQVFKQLLNQYGWNADDNLFSHKYISDTYRETDHQDPYAFFQQYGKSWDEFINALKGQSVSNSQPTETPKPQTNTQGSEYEMKVYKNGSTEEIVYQTSACTEDKKIGSLNPGETATCIGEVDGRAIVLYKIDGSNQHKVGFCKWLGGIQG